MIKIQRKSKGNGKSKGKTKGNIGSPGGHLNDDDEREEQGDTDDDEREDHDEREEQTAASSSEWPKGKGKVDGKDNQQLPNTNSTKSHNALLTLFVVNCECSKLSVPT